MAAHSSTLTWKIPWMEEPGRLQSMGSLRVGYDWVTSFSLFTFMYWRRKWQPTPVLLPGESQGRGSLVGCCLWVAQSWIRLKWLGSSSSSYLFSVLLHDLAWMNRNHKHDTILIKNSLDLRLEHSFYDISYTWLVKNDLLVKVPEGISQRELGH